MNRHIRIVQRARSDVHHIFTWLKRRSPRGATAWYQAFWQAAQRIASSAESFGLAPESERLQRQLRQAFFKTRRGRRYRIVFEVNEAEVMILRVRGPGQQLLRRRDVPNE
jgi:plasmid stabilization system protein ParE